MSDDASIVDDAELSRIKIKVNNLLFEVLPGKTTLDQLESLACNVTNQIVGFITEGTIDGELKEIEIR